MERILLCFLEIKAKSQSEAISVLPRKGIKRHAYLKTKTLNSTIHKRFAPKQILLSVMLKCATCWKHIIVREERHWTKNGPSAENESLAINCHNLCSSLSMNFSSLEIRSVPIKCTLAKLDVFPGDLSLEDVCTYSCYLLFYSQMNTFI